MNDRKVLLIDDDRDLLRGMTIRLRAAGYDVAQATDAVEAVAVAGLERPHAIILDLGLPGGDGFAVLEQLKSTSPLASIPIIVVSARHAANNRERALQAGAEAYFEKPADNKVLMHAIGLATGTSDHRRSMKSPRTLGESTVSKPKILIVEDHTDESRALSVLLRAEGFEVVWATSGAQATDQTIEERPDLILLDLGLPDGDGMRVLRRLKATRGVSTIPVIVVTAHAINREEEEDLVRYTAAFFQKPAPIRGLVTAIRRTLDLMQKT